MNGIGPINGVKGASSAPITPIEGSLENKAEHLLKEAGQLRNEKLKADLTNFFVQRNASGPDFHANLYVRADVLNDDKSVNVLLELLNSGLVATLTVGDHTVFVRGQGPLTAQDLASKFEQGEVERRAELKSHLQSLLQQKNNESPQEFASKLKQQELLLKLLTANQVSAAA